MSGAVSQFSKDESRRDEKGHLPLQNQEWIPMTLRPLSTSLLMAYCLALIIALELFNDLPSTRHGVPKSNNKAVQFATYFPTVLVVLFGIFWKRLIVDLKRVTPWSCLSSRWTLGKDSLELNYLDDLKLSLIWPAAKRRHWALLVGLLGGLVSGALVPLASALTYVDLAGINQVQVEVRHDGFDFGNTLLNSNSSLTLLKGSLGNTAWAGVANVLQSVGAPSWTTDSVVFASFHAVVESSTNRTIIANTTAITADLLCTDLMADASVDVSLDAYRNDEYNIQIAAHTRVVINLTGTDAPAGWSLQTVLKDPDTSIDPAVAWLNMSLFDQWTSVPNDTRIQLTLLEPIQASGPARFLNGTSSGY
ncbi:hypothetical protein DOTSEDRAFT_74155 [Dothistroma septosporum NZE10]|uniref:Uncharacterized protein n=1 Tax=Dothistroma septosporum (strain NZE10 / CBS 128990) TaxID=675120 RepID=N1PFX8_DOTSN|nr:hypothetical protein DOTSEDRAFT_74155 [Dothistroma septosporum NZE10]